MKIPESEMRFIYTRSSGPGGQNVNKVSSKVQVKWKPMASSALWDGQKALLTRRLASRIESDGEIGVTSEKTRSQKQNKQDAIARLEKIVEEALKVTKKRMTKTREPRGAKERRHAQKKATQQKKRNRATVHED